MIICYRHGFVFIKTRKTAGSSLEIALSRLCGPGDVVTRLPAEEEEVRRVEGGYGPANHDKRLREYRPREFWKRLRHGQRATRFPNHAGLVTARELADSTAWPHLLRITPERNPWDKAVSRYYWQKRRWEKRPRRTAFPPFTEYLEYLEREKPHWLSSRALYTLDGELAVDHFLFYEDLPDGLARLSRRLGLEEVLRLPAYRAKARGGSGRTDYRFEYDSRAREIVERVCRNEIEDFGYRFDAPGEPPARVPSPASCPGAAGANRPDE